MGNFVMERKKLSDIVNFARGTAVSPGGLGAGNVPVVTAGREQQGSHSVSNFDGPIVTISSHGAYAGHVNYWNSSIWLSNNVFALEILDSSQVDVRYLFHALKNMQQAVSNTSQSGGVPFINPRDLGALSIAIPALSVQKEISEKLGNFLELEIALSTELAGRQAQYDFFLDRIFGEIIESNDPTWVALGEVADITNGTRPSELALATGGRVPYLNGGISASGFVLESNTAPEAITIPARGSVGVVSYNFEPTWVGPLCYRISSKTPGIMASNYLFHWLKMNQDRLKSLQQTGSIPALNKSQLSPFQVPLVDASTQASICTLLDPLLKLSNPEQGPIALEVAARRKQYEYYRNQLLTFDEAAA